MKINIMSKKALAATFAGFAFLLSNLSAQIVNSSFTNYTEYGSDNSITFTDGAQSSGNPAVTIGGTSNNVTVEGSADLTSGDFTMAFSYGSGNTLAVTGGSIGGLQLNGLTSTTISGGQIQDITTGNLSDVTINGGEILGSFNLGATGASEALITGGSFLGDLNITNSSTLDILGGIFDSSSTLFVAGSSVVNISGSNFALDGISLLSDSIPSVNTGILTGTLADNSLFEMSIDVNNMGVINLTAVPEPSTVMAIIGSISLLVLLNHKRKRTATA